jgi:predicted Fe-Mo cluster-binding NifX family protein
MRICVPAETRDGPTAPVCGHFGSAPWFHIVDLDTGATSLIANAGHHHEHGACRPIDALMGHRIDLVACRAIGPNAVRQLNAASIDVRLCDAALVGDVVAQARANRLQPLDPDHLCAGGHGHRYGHGDEEHAPAVERRSLR